jgi:hypothetical protein
MGAIDLPRSALSRTKRLKGPSTFNVVKDLLEAEPAAIEEVEAGIRTLAELISTPPWELLPLTSVKDTKRRNFAISAKTRGTMSSNARS